MPEKKKFYQVEVPLINQKTELYGTSLEELGNRSIKMDLTRFLKGKSIEITFKVRVDKEKQVAIAEPKKLILMPFFIRRVLRKGIDYIEDSFSTECKNATLRIKPFLITRKRVSRKVKKALRNYAKQYLITYIKDKDYLELFSEIIGNRLQKPMSLKLKKIYPLALCEIRILEVGKIIEEPKKKKAEEPKKKEKTENKIKKEEKKIEEKQEIKKEEQEKPKEVKEEIKEGEQKEKSKEVKEEPAKELEEKKIEPKTEKKEVKEKTK